MAARRTAQAGMTLIELMISVSIFTVVLGGAYAMLIESQRYYDGATMDLVLTDRAQQMADRIANEIISGGRLNPPNPSNIDWIEFQKVTGISNGEAIFGPPVRYFARLAGSPVEINNNADDNNNGLADEMELVRWEYNADGSVKQENVIGRGRTKGGLRFSRTTDALLSEVITIGRDAQGDIRWGTAQTKVALRNP